MERSQRERPRPSCRSKSTLACLNGKKPETTETNKSKSKSNDNVKPWGRSCDAGRRRGRGGLPGAQPCVSVHPGLPSRWGGGPQQGPLRQTLRLYQ